MYSYLGFLSGVALFPVLEFFPVTTGVLFIFVSLFFVFKRTPVAIVLVITGFAYAFLRYTTPPDLSALSGKEVFIEGYSTGLPRETASGNFIQEIRITRAAHATTDEEIASFRGREVSLISPDGLLPGRHYALSIKMGGDTLRFSPGIIERERMYAYLEQVVAAQKLERHFLYAWLLEGRDRLNLYLRNTFEKDTAALLLSLTTGERSDMRGSIINSFAVTGLAHLLSISGTHFGLFSALVFGIVRLCIVHLPQRVLLRMTLYITPAQAAALVSLPVVIMYLLISGGSIPAIRSFIMITVFLFGLLAGRKGFWLNSLLFAACIICISDPSAVTDISFQLSFLAVLFIGYSVGDRKDREGRNSLLKKGVHLLKSTLTLTIAVSLGTAPLVAYYFHYFSVISPVSNLIITPLIGFVLVPLSIVAAFTFILWGYYPFQSLLDFLSHISLRGVDIFASVPFADIPVPAFPVIVVILFYAGLALYAGMGEKRLILACSALLIGACMVPSFVTKKSLSITCLDTGQGDAAVVESPGGMIIAIDTGRTGKELGAYLRYLGRKEIDALVLTHADEDHSGGFRSIMERFRVREVWDNGLLTYPEGILDSVLHRVLERGDEVVADGIIMRILHPYQEFYAMQDNASSEENNNSLVLSISGKDKTFLFLGDIEEEAEGDMLHLGQWLKSDVIKVAHHGSRTSSSVEFLGEVSPEIAVISVGRQNQYGHPHQETLERLKEASIRRTDREGAVKISEISGSLQAKTYRDFKFRRVERFSDEWRNIQWLFMRW